jgi:hypothetical protein
MELIRAQLDPGTTKQHILEVEVEELAALAQETMQMLTMVGLQKRQMVVKEVMGAVPKAMEGMDKIMVEAEVAEEEVQVQPDMEVVAQMDW